MGRLLRTFEFIFLNFRKKMAENWELPTEELQKSRRQWTDSETEINKLSSKIDGVKLPYRFIKEEERIKNFEVRPDNIWVVTYPKCGTTWTQEIIWQIVNGVNKEATNRYILQRSPFLEMECLFNYPGEAPADADDNLLCKAFSLDWTEKQKAPRVIKTHLTFKHLPDDLLEKAKVVYVSRNPLDCCWSYFHHHKMVKEKYLLKADFKKFAQIFKDGDLEYGSYWNHLESGVEKMKHPNLKFIWFEEIKKDPLKVIKELCDFTGYKLSEEKLAELVDITSASKMREAMGKSAGKDEKLKEHRMKFIRKGQVGDSKNGFSDEELKEYTKWMNENLTRIGIEIPK